MAKKLSLTFGYENTDFSRTYSIGDIASTLAAADMKTAIKAVNASLKGGTDGGLSAAFRSDDFDSSENIGRFSGITAAHLTEAEITVINLDTEGDASNG